MAQPDPKHPDISTCRAKYNAADGLVICLKGKPVGCAHSLYFGDQYYCRHPQNMEIASKSEAQR